MQLAEGKKRVGESRGLGVCFKESDYIVKTIDTKEELFKSYRLRYRIFCEELGWVPQNADAVETDGYDGNAVSFGVFDPFGGLSAYLRLIMPGEPFMIEREFLSMVNPEHVIRREKDTAEISRFCLAPESRRDAVTGDFGYHTLSDVLLKGIYRWCTLNGIRYLYGVTEQKIHRLACAKGFPFKLIGEPQHMPDGVIAVAMMLDWREFETMNKTKRPKLIEWFSRYQSVPPRRQWQRHEAGLRHQAFAL
jgi:N-acyl-L-homoserine lactone synthetase